VVLVVVVVAGAVVVVCSLVVVLVCANANGAITAQANPIIILFMVFAFQFVMFFSTKLAWKIFEVRSAAAAIKLVGGGINSVH
jgi:hypothetical protein